MKKHIPNIITLCNQMCGIIAAISAYEYDFRMALLFVVLGALFDFCDGASARFLKVQSPMGKELDSLADIITFGLVPGIVAFRLLTPLASVWLYIPYLGFLITLFSALRLAKFNIDTRQTTSFLGLATPANALFWLGLANLPIFNDVGGFLLILFCSMQENADYILLISWVILALVLLTSWFLVSEIPMFSLKFHNLKLKDNWVRFLFLALSLILLIIFHEGGLVFVIILYIIMSITLSKWC